MRVTASVRAKTRAGLRLAPVAALVLAASCASFRPYVVGPVLLVRVINDALPAVETEVWLAPAGRTPRLIGRVAPSSSRLLQTAGSDTAATYRLVAERPAGVRVTSPPFTVSGDGVVDWALAANALTPLGPRAPQVGQRPEPSRSPGALPDWGGA